MAVDHHAIDLLAHVNLVLVRVSLLLVSLALLPVAVLVVATGLATGIATSN